MTQQSLAKKSLAVSHSGFFFSAGLFPTGTLHLELKDVGSSLAFPSPNTIGQKKIIYQKSANSEVRRSGYLPSNYKKKPQT